jgi:hypothetical protein
MVADIPILGELPLLMLIRNAVGTQTEIQSKVTPIPTAVIKHMGADARILPLYVLWSQRLLCCGRGLSVENERLLRKFAYNLF